MLRRLGPILPLALVAIVVAGCSTDPTTTDEYQTLQQELATAESNLAAAETNLSAVEEELANLLTVAAEADMGSTTSAPPELAGLVDG
jgi:outer membrane protein TolC